MTVTVSQRIGILAALTLGSHGAHAEDIGAPVKDASNRNSIHGVATLLPTATGLVAIGGPDLRRLNPGTQRWEILHTVPGDNLYRVSADDTGRLLAAWSKDRNIQFIGPAPGRLVSLANRRRLRACRTSRSRASISCPTAATLWSS